MVISFAPHYSKVFQRIHGAIMVHVQKHSNALALFVLYICERDCTLSFSVSQTKERGSTRVHSLNNVNRVLQVLHQNSVSLSLPSHVSLLLGDSLGFSCGRKLFLFLASYQLTDAA